MIKKVMTRVPITNNSYTAQVSKLRIILPNLSFYILILLNTSYIKVATEEALKVMLHFMHQNLVPNQKIA
jgi:hypothetical protein